MDEALTRVLIVDDDGVIRRLLQVNFRLAGFESVAVGRGDLALAEAARSAPDAVVLDVMMPDIDGWEVLRQLRDDLGLADVPIVFLSAHSRDEDRERASAAGAVAYLTKPFDPAELITVVREALGVRAES